MKKTIGERLALARNNAGLSLAELSAKTNGEIIRSRISNYEKGIRKLPVDVAVTLSKYLNVPATYLLGLEDEYLSAFEDLGENQKELFRLLNQVSLKGDQELEKVARMLKGYLDSN